MRYQSKRISKTQINISAWILALTALTVENEKKADVKSQSNKGKENTSITAA
ncbi:MAG: hypothetical protein K6F69_07385 [Treponema sp.]|nr:hypothetical protein [Treponema sp.]